MKRLLYAAARRIRGNAPATSFQSFSRFLPGLLELQAPTRVLEFGPGTSTRIFLEHSAARITSIETSERWFRHYAREFRGNDRVSLLLRERDWDMSRLEDHVGRDFDFVFIDGGARQEALVQVQPLLAPGAVVVVHDAHRDDYYWAMLRYRYLLPAERHSCILTDDPETFRRVVEGVEVDYETMSPYSRKPYRMQYFDDLLAKSKRDRAALGVD